MLPEQIMSSDLLDILFADRNKSYGAYPLRREYNKRLTKALVLTGVLVGVALIGYYSSGKPRHFIARTIFLDSLEAVSIPPPKEPKPLTPPPPPPALRRISVREFTTPVIDDHAEQPPPTIEELDSSQVGVDNINGVADNGFPPPPANGSNSAFATTTVAAEPDILEKVEIESAYPGGQKAWVRFLMKTFKYPYEAEEKEIQGSVLVKFIVDKEGNVSNIQALSGHESLREEAIRVISKSGKWIPAIQNGQTVSSYKYQPIIFRLAQ
jgi:periplasmic protein TonB